MMQMIRVEDIRTDATGTGIVGQRGVLYQTSNETPSRLFWWDGERHVPLLNGAQVDGIDAGNIVDAEGGVFALSEAVAVVTRTATGTAFSGACEFRGFVVRAETGGTADVTIYDATSATGTAIMTVANITTGTYYWDGDHATAGVGNGGRRVNSTGCHVVIAGTCTIDVMVE